MKKKQKVVSFRVDEELWVKAKICAAKKRMTLTELMTSLLAKEVSNIGD